MLKKLIVAAFFFLSSASAHADPETNCPCFNAMYAAGTCSAILQLGRENADLRFFEASTTLVCYTQTPTSGDFWRFDAIPARPGIANDCVVLFRRGTNTLRPRLEIGITDQELAACQEELAVAYLLLSDPGE